MVFVSNTIVPMATGFTAEPKVNGRFVCDFRGFHVEYAYNPNSSNLLLFTERVVCFYDYKAGCVSDYAVEDGGKWFLLDGLELKPLVDEGFVTARQSSKGEKYLVERVGRWKYRLVDLYSGKENIFEKRGFRFVADRNDFLYFKRLDAPNNVMRFQQT